MKSNVAQQKEYWDHHPIGAEPFESAVGSEDFYEKYLAYYDQLYDYKGPTFQYGKYAHKDVLEIGCGLGIDTIKFAKAGARTTAIDLSETSANCTKSLFEHFGLEGDIRPGDAQQLEFPDNSFDVVYAYGVLMHVEDVEAVVNETYRVLRPGGEALTVLYHRWSWYWMLVKLSGTNVESEEGDPTLIRVFSKSEAQSLFSRFSSVAISGERLPKRTIRRNGIKANCYNRGFVTVFEMLPKGLAKKFGWHLIIKAVK